MTTALPPTGPTSPTSPTSPTRSRPQTRAGRRRGARLLRRGLPAVVAAVAFVALTQSAASAHVRVRPDSTVTGTFSALTFRVPDESATAGTVKVAVTLPADRPFLSVSTKPVPGWQAVTTEAPLPAPVVVDGTTVTKAARTVTWTADPGVQIDPGEYQEFSISAGPLPPPGTVELPAIQTYSDGTVTSWDQSTPAGGAEPEHPAPAFVVTAATTAAAASPAAGAPDPTSAVGSVTETSADPVARVLGGLGLLSGLGALTLVLVRRRRATVSGARTDG